MKRPKTLAETHPEDAAQWERRKKENLRVADMYSTVPAGQRLGEGVRHCSYWLKDRDEVEPETGEVIKSKIVSARLCHVRLCPICLSWKATYNYAIYMQAIKHILAYLPSACFVFLDITIKNCLVTELRATIKDIHAAHGRLVQRKAFTQAVVGWIRITEVTINEEYGEAHPHLHYILHVSHSYFGPKYIKKTRWVKLCAEVLKINYSPEIHVRNVKQHENIADELSSRLNYILKPMKKIVDPDLFIALDEQISSLRFVSCGGRFKTVLKKIKKKGRAAIHSENSNIVRIRWDTDNENYILLDIYNTVTHGR